MAPMTDSADPVLKVRGLHAGYAVKEAFWRRPMQVSAVAGLDLDVPEGKTLGIVGESGCGKSTLARTLVGLLSPTDGNIAYDGRDVTAAGTARWREVRRDVQMVFQDPHASLNPHMTARELISEAWQIHPGIVERADRDAEVERLLDIVGLRAEHADRYPNEFSGGQQQRICIARALAVRPKLIVCDEAVSALDVSVQAQILNLLVDLQDELGLSYVFISHDLEVVRHVAHEVAVMYLGTIVERGTAEDVFGDPQHPYTRALLSAAPSAEDWRGTTGEIELTGEVPSPAKPPSGCRFRTRCYMAQDRCADEVPPLIERPGVAHPVSCHFADGAGTTAP